MDFSDTTGIAPTDLLAKGREEVLAHGAHIVQACATRIQQTDGLFSVSTTTNEEEGPLFTGKRLLLATGLRDLTPNCRGFRDFYGTSVHHCPDCDGFEVSNKRVAVLSHGEHAVGFTMNLLTWTDKLVLLTDGHRHELPEAHLAKLDEFNIPIRDEKISALEGDFESEQLKRVCFSEGQDLECDALFFNLGTEPANDLHKQLGCRLENHLVWVDRTQQTSVSGVYAAGDITPNSQLAVVAAAEGAMAAIHMHQSLIPESRKIS
jgi:thioredoxin reductase